MSDHDPISRSELREMFERNDRVLLAAILEALGAAPAAAAVRKAGARPDRDEGLPEDFIKARREVAKAIRNPLVSFGDAGFRSGDGLHDVRLTKLGGEDSDATAGPALRSVRARARARRRREEE